jgi:glucokinase
MSQCAIGLDIGGTEIKAGLVDTAGKIVLSDSQKTGADRSREEVFGNIKAVVTRLLENKRLNKHKILGIGAGTPGLPDKNGKILSGAYNIKGWNGAPLGDFLRKTFSMDVVVENDVTALALGESCFGNGKPYSNIVVLAFGTGLGGGIIINKNVYRGHSGYAAEIGHMIVNGEKDAPFCTCGTRGCLETYASTVGIRRMLKERTDSSSKLNAESMPKEVYALAKKGDKLARQIVDEVGYRLGIGLASLVHLFDPDAVILGGGIANAGSIFFSSFKKTYESHILPHYRKNKVPFLPTRLGHEGGIVGSAALILHNNKLV